MASDLSTAGCLPSAAHSLDRFAQERPLLPPLPQPAPSHLGGSARLPVVHTAVCTAGRCRGHTSARLHERVHQPLTQLIHSAGPPRMPSWQPGAWCQLASSLSSEACHSWLLASTATLDRALVRAAASSSDRLSAATTSVSLFRATRTCLLDAAPSCRRSICTLTTLDHDSITWVV